MKWVGLIVALIGILALAGWFLSGGMNNPGELIADQGREHWDRDKLVGFEYNSRPPTSGPHDLDWIRPGTFEVPQDKYKLIHSLEHGYIEIHYNCAIAGAKVQRDRGTGLFDVSAHGDEVDSTPSAVATDSAKLVGEQWSSKDCDDLRSKLASFVKKLNLKRVILQPNPDIDSRIVIVAWDRKLVLDPWDEKLAEKFARAYHNHGPEQTME